MPPRGSKSTIPIFIFLGLVLVFLPIAALVCVCLQRRHQRRQIENPRAGTAHAVAESMHWWSKSSPIEMGDLQPPPPPPPPPPAAVAIRPIRGMSVGKRPTHYMHGALGAHEENEHGNPRGQTAQTPTRVDEHHSRNQPRVEARSPAAWSPFSGPSPLHSPRYDLQAVLGGEDSPASVRTGGERQASLSEAPRVKSQKVSPQEAALVYHAGERPAVPEL
ncbi:hypothetical protein G647_05078 [Cladophialophora carrionii CBS 160.54]|uniref:Uncharacterized protein n=1 Tax=Cladophialophora carrionii CBS 160.54 TaxID=1279043 RepID=V9D8N1_9EURO|nr:uncharacterized protein G647_05078 [Cladophialophora carrionii CBS 160.54]ETI23279.1 hypothetical protein G647_05078 [Cladophialophora carrionii CBS 160.54]